LVDDDELGLADSCGQAAIPGEVAASGERPYRLLVNAVRDCAIFLLDSRGQIATWSTGAENVTGFSAADVIGRFCSCLYPPEDVAAGKPIAMLSVAATHGRIEDEGYGIRKDGSRFSAEVIITAITAPSGALIGYAEIARDATVRVQLEQDLGDAQDRLRALAARLERTSEQDKMRLAREIHDVLGQELTGLKLDSAWLARRIDRMSEPGREVLLERLETMASRLDGCMQFVRRIATGLRPGMLDDLGLAAAIEWQAREFEERAGIVVDLSLPEDSLNVDRDRATAIFRIFQELITNTVRHAGARNVSVLLKREADAVELEVSDDGRGITALEQSRPDALGILGMRERVAQFGGSLDIRGIESQGTRARVRIPV
jgi:PAS domain S-box-containing protein